MSMFKTLQNIPSTITVFQSLKMPSASKNIISILQNHSLAQSTTNKPKSLLQKFTSSSSSSKAQHQPHYQLDITTSIPTKEQYGSIRTVAGNSPLNQTAFTHLFPKFEWRTLPSLTEYQLRVENGGGDGDGDAAVFRPPLVVDWDHGLIATDEEGVLKIIQVFEENEKSSAKDE